MSGLHRLRNRLTRAFTGIDPTQLAAALREQNDALAALGARFDDVIQARSRRIGELDELFRKVDGEIELLNEERRIQRDGTAKAREALESLRGTPEYERLFIDAEPLVTVRIASFRKTEELVDIAIRSVLRQTYERFEIVVVNDGPNDRTRAAIEGLHDPRIRYEEFPQRNVYPRSPQARWMVAGAPGMNRGAAIARGAWIAPLDDDDEFTPDHIELLLALALKERAEAAYGRLTMRNLVAGQSRDVFHERPNYGSISMQAMLYTHLLDSIFQFDTESWRSREPGDWNLIRRMDDAGVRFAATSELVGYLNMVPYQHKDPRD